MRLLLICLILHEYEAFAKCCRNCACSNRCEAPNLSANLTTSGLTINCPDADCACVVDELDTCTYGQVWKNTTEIGWQDARWNKCIIIETLSPLRARANIRWWRNKCMGHIILNLDVSLADVYRDLYVDFNVLSFFEHDTIHNTYRIETRSGSDDDRPMAGSSNMFFEANLVGNNTGVHVEVTDCTVQIIEGTDVNAKVMNEFNVFDPNNFETTPNGMRINYPAFWDSDTNSPYQRLVCHYALFNGTTNDFLLHNTVNRTYMIADPDEKGILINDRDDAIRL